MTTSPHPDDQPPARRGPVFHFEITDELCAVFRQLNAHKGEALSSLDLADELGLPRLEVAAHLITLVRLRFAGTRPGNGRILYYALEEEPA